MRVTDEQVARVVAEVSAGAEDPRHLSSLVGGFMQRQPIIGHYVSSHERELSLEGVVLTLLHASVVERCLEMAEGRALRAARPEELDAAARISDGAQLQAEEPALHGYLVGNIPVEDATLGGPRRDVALGLLFEVARTFLDL